MTIAGGTSVLAIIGQKIEYTLSPAIHNFSAAELRLPYVYVPFDFSTDDLAPYLKTFWHLGLVGFNVTTPYKTQVAALVPSSGLTSVNTVYRKGDNWAATSTDAEGLAMSLSRLGTHLTGFRRIIVLGNGGVVSAILRYIAERFESLPEVSVLRRDPAKDRVLIATLPPNFSVKFLEFDAKLFHDLVVGAAGETLVIQATNAPRHGDDLKRFGDAFSRYNGVFVDLVYGSPSALLTAAQKRGIPCQDGLPMLIEQARLAQKLWWGQAASYESIERFLATMSKPSP